MTSGPLERSLASWCDAHGFGILCINTPLGEHFVVHARNAATDFDDRTVESWARVSESQAKAWMGERGLRQVDAEDAIRLAREWTTSITGSGALAAPFESA
jgi:hypothetical protein